ncbi:MAG: hypothetical protein M0013_06220 [Actinomycetota bacterium]|nr:hypothetical protein [Actinomycetota bacterium]
MTGRGSLHLAKYHGAGNDFLVLIDPQGRRALSAAEARALCDRRRGVGADGVLRVGIGEDGSDLQMELRNADGSVAEMSGNGIRCLVHAAADAGLVPTGTLSVATAAGVRQVSIELGPAAGMAMAEVDMGVPVLGAELRLPQEPGSTGTAAMTVIAGAAGRPGAGGVSSDPGGGAAGDLLGELGARLVRSGHSGAGVRARWVDMGNPHLVVLVPVVDSAVVSSWGAEVDARTPGGTNVELVRVVGRHMVELGVWERGAGATLACGTGSCAAAACCWDWDLADAPVTVRNPGGDLRVDRRGSVAMLAGPSVRVADVRVDEAVLAALVAAGEPGPGPGGPAGPAGAAGDGSPAGVHQ